MKLDGKLFREPRKEEHQDERRFINIVRIIYSLLFLLYIVVWILND
jgi:hypothetical protein